jgi:hypothetical protein
VSPVIPLSTRSSISLGARPSKELRAKGPGDSLAQVQDVNIAENSFPTFHGNTLNRFRQVNIIYWPDSQSEPAYLSN